MKRFITAVVSPLLLLSFADQGQAQLIQVRPGYVRAPFVRVYRGPGGVSVRAPFVSINRGYYGPQRVRRYSYPPDSGVVTQQAAPSTQNLSMMTWQSLRETIRTAASQLEQDLNRHPYADSWKSHLQVTAIRELVTASDQPPAAAAVEPLRRILATYSSARGNPDFDSITSQSNFRRLHAALNEYLAPESTRHLRRLAESSRQLHQELARLQNGAGWQEYLSLPPSIVSAAGTDLQPAGQAPAQDGMPLGELQKVRERFDAVSENADYNVIASLPAFRWTQEILGLILDNREPTPIEAEPLPAPQPEQP